MKNIAFLSLLILCSVSCANDDTTTTENEPIINEGTIISEVFMADSYWDEIPEWSISFTDNGTKLNEIKRQGILKTKFYYDSNDRLHLVEKFSTPTLTYNYEFFYDEQDRIESVIRIITNNGQVSTDGVNYTYEGNFIYSYEDGNLKRSYELNNDNRFTEIFFYEPYFDTSISHTRRSQSFEYFENTGAIDNVSFRNQNWHLGQGYGTDSDYFRSVIRYDDTRPNIFLDCYSNIYFNFMLAQGIFEFHYYFNEATFGLFEENFQTVGLFANTYLTGHYHDLVNFEYHSNGYPSYCEGGFQSSYWHNGKKFFYRYE